MIRAIAAIDSLRGIAAHGGIPWNIPIDTRYFADMTAGATVLMGAATYNEFVQPLPGRRNVVASRTLGEVRAGFELIHDVDHFLQTAPQDVWIIGGAKLYASTLRYCQELYITEVEGNFGCDRFFPPYAEQFSLATESPWQTDTMYNFRFSTYIKNR